MYWMQCKFARFITFRNQANLHWFQWYSWNHNKRLPPNFGCGSFSSCSTSIFVIQNAEMQKSCVFFCDVITSVLYYEIYAHPAVNGTTMLHTQMHINLLIHYVDPFENHTPPVEERMNFLQVCSNTLANNIYIFVH